MSGIQAIRSAVKTKLETLKGTGKPFVNVYDFYTTKPSGFPFAMFEPGELNAEYEDTENNYRNYTFKIVLVQEMNEITRGDALNILLNCFEKTINAFDIDFTLAGVVEQVDAMQGQFGEIDMENGPCLFVTMNINCRSLFSIG